MIDKWGALVIWHIPRGDEPLGEGGREGGEFIIKMRNGQESSYNCTS